VFPLVPGDKKPVIPKCSDAKDKELVGNELARHAHTCSRDGHGLYDATTDPRKIHAWWNRWPDANIGMPTGERSEVFVPDIDVLAALAKLEKEHGKLPSTLQIRTPSGGIHFYFRHVEGVTNSSGGLPEGIDVRGEGGYVLLPPSTTAEGSYVVEHRAEIAEAPEWLLELIREKKPPAQQPRRRGRAETAAGETIPEGHRNQTLFFAALEIKDRGETPAEVLDRLLAMNESRCSPPLIAGEVERIAKSACRYPIRSGTPSPEVLEAVERLEEDWWERPWQGMGGKTDRDVDRVLIELARRYGTLLEDGSVAVSASVRSVALAAATRYETVSGRATKRLAQAGLIRKTGSGRKSHEHAATWGLLPQARLPVNTQASTYVEEHVGSVYDPSRLRLWDVSTPAFRWTGHVKKGRAGVLYILEARGSMRLEELAELMGWSRPRDLRLRYVDPLVELGLVEDRGGELALVDGHVERVEEVRRAPYTTVRRRRRKSADISVGRVVHRVEETEHTASEVEREEQQWRDDEDQRRRYREGDEQCRELLDAWDEERESADGEIRELVRLGPDDEPPDDHPPGCQCVGCYSESLRSGEAA
jgi:hypothetical protein